MPLEIVMPKLGLTMTEGLIVEWKFKEGDKVKKGDILFLQGQLSNSLYALNAGMVRFVPTAPTGGSR